MFYFRRHSQISFFFFFNDTATTEIYTLSLHDALPISFPESQVPRYVAAQELQPLAELRGPGQPFLEVRSEEHTSELQSRLHLVCRLLLEKKKNKQHTVHRPCTRGHSPRRGSLARGRRR